MSEHASTYVLVLAATYPELRTALEKLMGEPLNSKSLEKFQMSMVHKTLMYDLEMIVHEHASNYNRINLCLKKIDEVIEHISNINYAHLDDEQKKRLPNLAKEVDGIHYQVKEEIAPQLMQEKAQLAGRLSKQLEMSVAYLNNLNAVMNKALEDINGQFKLKVEWTEGKSIWNWDQLKDWIDRNQQIDAKITKLLLSIENDENITNMLKAVLIMEVMVSMFSTEAESKSESKSAEANKVVKFVKSMVLEGIKFPKVEEKLGSRVGDMEANAEKSESLHEEVQGFPLKEEGDQTDISEEINKITKDLGTFTTVDKAVDEG